MRQRPSSSWREGRGSRAHRLWFGALTVLLACSGCVGEAPRGGTQAVTCSARGPLRVAGGSGTEEDPWTIGTCDQLRSLDVACTGHFALANDVDCEGTAFEPLGADAAFRGTLDGRGHAISGVRVASSDAGGLFAHTQGATLTRLTLVADVAGTSRVGGLVGTAIDTVIRAVGVVASVRGRSSVGGLAGLVLRGEVVDSFARADVSCGNPGADPLPVPVRGETSGVAQPPRTQGNDACGSLIGQAVDDVHLSHSYGVSEQHPRLVGFGATSSVMQASFYDCEIGEACGDDEQAVATRDLQSVEFLERNGWDLDAVWGVRGWDDYPCHRFESACGVVRVAVDETLAAARQHDAYEGVVRHEVARLDLDGAGFDFYDETFVLEAHPDELEELLAAEQLEVLEQDAPLADDGEPSLYLVRARSDAAPCGHLDEYLRRAEPGLDGRLTFSGESARNTFCRFLSLVARGYAVDLDAPMDDDTYTHGSDPEAGSLAWSPNVIDWTDFGMRFGVAYGIPEAWEALEAFGREPHVTINVAGTGFALHFDFDGEVGENFVQRRGLFEGETRHGASAAAVVSAVPGNGWGVAGTVGPYARRTVIWGAQNQWQMRRAMRHARRQGGASILVISQSISTPRRLRILRRGMNRTAQSTFQANTLVVASASNDGEKLGASRLARMPCEADHVLCVGGLESGTLALAEERSNWGGPVDLFAPNQGPGFPSDGVPTDTIGTFDGTSYAAPFVAGVAALVWTADPELTVREVVTRLRETARRDSTDERVPAVVNPYEAVLAALPSRPPLARLTGTQVFEGSTILVGQLTVFPGEVISDEALSSVSWTSDRSGVLSDQATLSWTPTADDVGRHLLELTATSVSGLTTSLVLEVFVRNENAPPVIAGLFVNPEPYVPGVLTVLSADVSDADDDALTYVWSASDVPYPYQWRPLGEGAVLSSIDLTSRTVTWIRLTVTDPVGNRATLIRYVYAINPGSPTVIEGVVTYVKLDEFGLTHLQVDASAVDPEEGTITADRRFRWFFTGSGFDQFSYSGNHGTFTVRLPVPFCTDIPVVNVTARDSAGNTGNRRATVEGCCGSVPCSDVPP